MTLPFTTEEFFGVFAEYNRAFWPVVVAWWLTTIAVATRTWRQPDRSGPMLSLFLASLWLWNAGAYHALLFTRINPAAWIFAALFALQAAVFLRLALRRQTVYLSSSGVWPRVGLMLIAYALLYPFLTIALGHDYPATPTFGLPCPTVILTAGLLLTVRETLPASFTAIPVLWGFIGGSAAILLEVQTDYPLLAAGVLLLIRR